MMKYFLAIAHNLDQKYGNVGTLTFYVESESVSKTLCI
jgi:hypothetical protein